MARKFELEEIGNGWLLTMGDQQPLYFASLELCVRQLEPHMKCRPREKDEVAFRNGGAQIDLEELLQEKKDGA